MSLEATPADTFMMPGAGSLAGIRPGVARKSEAPTPGLPRPRAGARIETHRLRHGSSLVLAPRAGAEDNPLVVVLGGGRGCVLRADATLAGIWIPLRGSLYFSSRGSDCALPTGELRVSEGEAGGARVVGRGDALWVAALGRREAWRSTMAGFAAPSLVEALLLPSIHPAARPLRRTALALARAVVDGRAEVVIETLLDRVLHLQGRWAAVIACCPGRTHAQRRQVFLRLQRVRNYVVENSHLDLEGAALARMANFSPWHFIRAFRSAYGETPHAFLVDQRLRRARRLLTSSTLAISEIALAIGFESRSAFSRLFRRRFGITAFAVRRDAGRQFMSRVV